MAIEDLINAVDDYDREQLDLSMSGSLSKNPDQSAKVFQLSKEKNLPVDYVERNFDKVSAPDVSNVGKSVAQLLRDRQKAAMAHDDIDNLSWWETTAQEAGNIGKLVPSAAKSISSAGYSAIGSTFNSLAELSYAIDTTLGVSQEDIDKGDFLGAAGKYMLDIARKERADAEYYFPKKSILSDPVLGGVKSAMISLPALAASVAARNPKLALGALGGVTYGDSYLTAKDAGLDEMSSMSYASNQMIAEVVTEKIPLGRLLKDLDGNTGFLKTVATQMAIEIPSEQVATVWQDALDWAVINPDKTLREFIDERPDAAANTLISTIVATGIQTSAISGIDRLTRARESEKIQEISDKANESKLRGRAPEVFADYINDLTEEYGSPDAIYIDAKEIKPLFQGMEKDAAYDLIASQIDEAEAVGGDIVIPMKDFVATLATSKNFESIKGAMRLSAESPTAAQLEGQPQRISDLIDSANKNIATKTRADEIYQEVTKQLINTGRMNADVAKTSASIIPSYVTTKSIRSGLSVDEVYGMMGLKIEGPTKQDETDKVLSQRSLSEWDEILRGLDYADGKPQQGQDDATEFLSNAPAGTRYTDESKLLKRVRKSSDQIFNELGGSPEAGRVGKTSLGQFTGYRTQADIIEPDSIYPDGRIQVHVFGKEQDESGISDEPALTFTVTKDGELSVNGPTGDTFTAFKEAGWAKESTGKDGEVQSGWTSLVNKDGSQMPLSQLLPLISDVHARVRAWRGDDKIGLHWSRSTGATGGIVGGRQTAVFFQPEKLPEKINIDGIDRSTIDSTGKQIASTKQGVIDFWGWFGNSEVVDKKGNPLVVYHGTNKKFEVFDPALSDGFWFTDSKEALESDSVGATGINYIMPSYLKAENLKLNGDNSDVVSITEDGYDGILNKYDYGNDYAVINPEQIKSATGNQGAFDPSSPSILMQSAQDDKNLFVAHNLSESNILAAAKLGGLAAPSLAVARSDIGFDSFGEITLIAKPEFLQDQKARTFNADIYSPRQPRSIYDIDAKKFRELLGKISADADAAGGLRLPDMDRLSDGADDLLRSEGLQYHWLKTQGIDPKIVKKKVPDDLKSLVSYASKNNIKYDYNLQEDEGFRKLAEAQIKKSSDEIVASGMESPYLNDDGSIDYRFVQKLASKTIREINTKGIDKSAMQDGIAKKMRNKAIRKKYEDYVTEIFNDIKKGEKLFKGFTSGGDKKYAPYTMENVVKEMTSGLQGAEKTFYGAGSVRSAFAKEMKTLQEVKNSRDKIISDQDFEKIKEESNKVFLSAMDSLKPYYKFDADSWNYMDDAGSAIIEGDKGLRETFNNIPAVKKIVGDLKEYLSELPTYYFESKVQRAVGFNEFDTAIVPKNISAQAMKVLEDSGIKIKKYDPSKENDRQKVIQKQKDLLFQGERGSFDPSSGVIKLGQASDLSTFLHESGHLFLEMEGRLFAHPNATPQMKADGQVILDWLGLESFDQLKDYETNDVSRAAHEKFARGFEKYLGEGKAPSVELKSVFRRFAAWMRQVYRDLKKLNVELTDDVRAVMDRMLATDDQISRLSNGFDPLFKDAKEAGMTDSEFKAYSNEASPDSAKEVLLAKMIKQLNRQYTKWWKDESVVVAERVRDSVKAEPLYSALSSMRAGGTTKEARALSAEIEAMEDSLRKLTRNKPTIKQAIARAGGINRQDAIDNGIDSELIKERFVSRGMPLFPKSGGLSFDGVAELLNQEGYNLDANGALDLVQSALASDQFVDMDINAQAENLQAEIGIKSSALSEFGANRLNYDDVHTHFFGDIPGKFIGLTSKSGSSPDDIAAIHGLASGSELIDLINTQPSLSEKVKQLTEQEMISRHGDILNDGTIREEAEQALRNPEHAKKLIAELNALSRKTKTTAIDRESIKAYAQETIAKMAVSKIRPNQYRAAEVRAAREAAIAKNKGDFAAAQKAKTQELINFYLSREASLAKEKAERIRASQKAIQARKYSASNIDMDYVNEVKILLRSYDFRKTSESDMALSRANIERVRLWIESQQKDPETVATFVKAEILGKLIPYSDMTLEDLQGLDDVVKSILHAGRGLAEENKEAYRANIDEGKDSIVRNRIDTYETEADSGIPWVQAKSLFNEATASLRKFESFARQSDGMNEQGWVWRNTVKPLLNAANEKIKRQRIAHSDLREIFQGFNNAFSHMRGIKTFNTEAGQKIRLSYGARISIALNLGNDGNLDALKAMDKLPLTDTDISNITSSLSEADWGLVQRIWDYIDTYWPEISALEIKRSGVAPMKVQPRAFVTPSGIQMRGGYYPLAGDAAADGKQLERDIDTMASAMMNGGSSSKSTKHGSTIERVGFGGTKIDFSIGVLFNHIDGVVHDITHWKAVKDVDRVLKNEKISSELSASLGLAGVKAMKQRLKEIAAGPQRLEGLGWVNRVLRHARLASTYSALGYSVRTAAMNAMGITTAVADMSLNQVASGTVEYYSNITKMNQLILDKSEYMRDRGLTLNRDIAYIRANLRGDNAFTRFKDGAFWMMTQMDKAITRPIWLSAYREGEMMFKSEKEAIDYADRMVARTQGSGMDLDLANVETKNELMKAMTVMYTAFSAIYNISTEQTKRYKAGKISGTNLAWRMAWLTVVPGILTSLLTGSDDDEPEDVLWEVAGQGIGMIPIARDAFSYARYGASFPTPIVRLTTSPIKFVDQLSQGEVDKGLVGATAEMASWLHIPGGAQLTRTYGYLSDVQDGEIEEFSPIDLLITGKE